MAASVESIIESFPYPTISAIIGEPTYESITAVARHLKANAASVHTELGGGALGHLALLMTPAVYATISLVPYNAPGNPGPTPNLDAGGTAPVLSAIIRTHTENLRLWRLHTNLDKALKQQLIGSVNRMYIRTLEDQHIGFANVSTLDLLQHLLQAYGRITEHALSTNDTKFKTPMDPSQPFESFITQLEDSIEYAAAGNAPYTTPQVLTTAYTLVFNTGIFTDACREWRRKPAADKTWATFKTHFAEAHQDYRQTETTARTAGYHSANNAMTTFGDALANLATTTASDRTLMSELQATNTELLRQMALQTNQISQLRSQLAAPTSTPVSNTNSNQTRGKTRFNKNTNYCWTHGYDVADSHTSATCSHQKTGHKLTATKSDNMGVSQRNKHLVT